MNTGLCCVIVYVKYVKYFTYRNISHIREFGTTCDRACTTKCSSILVNKDACKH